LRRGKDAKTRLLNYTKHGVLTNPGAAGKVAAELKSKLEMFPSEKKTLE